MGIKRAIKSILRKLIAEQPNVIEKPPFLLKSIDFLKVGKESYHNGNFVLRGEGSVRIGNYCAFGKNITIIKSNHNYNFASTQYTFYRKNFGELPYQPSSRDRISVEIGNDVWIGDNVTILPNVKIGNGACIGAGSIVTKDVDSYTITAGVPAKRIKDRFNEKTKRYLEEIQWWNMTESEIKENKTLFFKNFNEDAANE